MNTHKLCPCGSNIEYGSCCGAFHSGDKFPLTAEALMRSRFSAYALDLLDYLQSTWDASSRPKPEKLNFGGEPIEWLRLEILSVNKGGAADKKGVVEFKAYYRQNGADQLLQEASRFIKTNGRWYYLDGVVKSVGQKIQQVKEGKNAPCSCGSGKKFKRCCGTN